MSRTKYRSIRLRLTRLKMDESSRCVQRGDGDGREEGRDLVQERCDRARTGQVEETAVLVLFDLGCYFEECQDHGGGLGGGQGRRGQGMRHRSQLKL